MRGNTADCRSHKHNTCQQLIDDAQDAASLLSFSSWLFLQAVNELTRRQQEQQAANSELSIVHQQQGQLFFFTNLLGGGGRDIRWLLFNEPAADWTC